MISRNPEGKWILLNELKEIVQSFDTREDAVEALKTVSSKVPKTERPHKHGRKKWFHWYKDNRERCDLGFHCLDCGESVIERTIAVGYVFRTEGGNPTYLGKFRGWSFGGAKVVRHENGEIMWFNHLGEIAEEIPEKYW